MIQPEQKELAEYIKQVHLSLRCNSRQIGAEKAWKQHLENEEVLQKYAFCMKKLAEDYWSSNNQSSNDALLCRIEWMAQCVVDYFQKGGFEKEMKKEEKKMTLFLKKDLITASEFDEYRTTQRDCEGSVPYKLLDVGSCYNPFKKFDFFEVYPIDLYPASPEVKKCNFIDVEVSEVQSSQIQNWFCDTLKCLPSNYFNIVVFSLFLEYLPSPKQRYIACVKAYETLTPNGILLIATPDSKHASANAHIMKSWKLAAAKIGFVRTRLEKLKYLHCMTFRKASFRKYPLLLNNIAAEKINEKEMFIIPQDFVEYKVEEKRNENFDEGEINMFSELPFLSSFEEDVEAD